MSIRLKLLLAALSLTAVTVALGIHAQGTQRELGLVATRIYDEAVIAVSYLRSAQNTLARAEAQWRRHDVESGSDLAAALTNLVPDVLEDLDVACERAMSPAGRRAVDQVRYSLQRFAELMRDAGSAEALAVVERIEADFATAVEVYAADGYRRRQSVNDLVAQSGRQTWYAILLSVAVALAITALLSRSIVPTLRKAVGVAQAIASGRLDNLIDARGSGETAHLLRALAAMQASIAAAMARIQALMDEQARSHAGELAGEHAKLMHMARHDALTGLPNRVTLGEHLPGALVRARRDGGLAVLCLDLDRFKAVNDTLGHAAGDALLRVVAQRLRACTRESDLVARLGGDEFAIVQERAELPTDAAVLARRVIAALSAPYEIEGQQVQVGTSIGIALSGEELPASSEGLLKCSDLALYRAKADGRGTFRFFDPEMDAQARARRVLEVDLRRALARDEFEVFYQPLVATRGAGGIGGFEALLRWRHPARGMVSPAVFIPLAEEIGLIGAIGEWVLRQACTDAARWPGALKVAVNLSPAQFRGGRALVAQVADALAASGLVAGRLELEVTESVLLQDDDAVLATLHGLRALGVRIAMDDFGTGYSSLGYLRRFPFDKIKIDQSFVRGMAEHDDCGAIVRAIIGLGRSLGIAVNAEGVETPEQLAALRAEGCGEVQGYLFSPPKPVGDVAELLRRHGTAALPGPLARGEAKAA